MMNSQTFKSIAVALLLLTQAGHAQSDSGPNIKIGESDAFHKAIDLVTKVKSECIRLHQIAAKPILEAENGPASVVVSQDLLNDKRLDIRSLVLELSELPLDRAESQVVESLLSGTLTDRTCVDPSNLQNSTQTR